MAFEEKKADKQDSFCTQAIDVACEVCRDTRGGIGQGEHVKVRERCIAQEGKSHGGWGEEGRGPQGKGGGSLHTLEPDRQILALSSEVLEYLGTG